MNNLIKNPQWKPGPNGGPKYFSGSGSTYDDLAIDGHRTCSITQTESMTGYDQYDFPIPTYGNRQIRWGYMIRMVDAECISLMAEFYHRQGKLISQETAHITDQISYQFSFQSAVFKIPHDASFVKLSLQFRGKITACTYYAPAAYFSKEQ